MEAISKTSAAILTVLLSLVAVNPAHANGSVSNSLDTTISYDDIDDQECTQHKYEMAYIECLGQFEDEMYDMYDDGPTCEYRIAYDDYGHPDCVVTFDIDPIECFEILDDTEYYDCLDMYSHEPYMDMVFEDPFYGDPHYGDDYMGCDPDYYGHDYIEEYHASMHYEMNQEYFYEEFEPCSYDYVTTNVTTEKANVAVAVVATPNYTG